MTASVLVLRQLVEEAADQPSALDAPEHRAAVEETIDRLDRGELRTAEKSDGEWTVNDWVQRAILLYFKLIARETLRAGAPEYSDRIPLKHDLIKRGVLFVPGAIVRYGSHVEPGAVVMPAFVNVGAYVASGTMVDTWATVGSGAQIGHNVHLARGVGIGGVLEAPGARPVIVEDGAFLGSRSIVVEGVVVEGRAVLAPQVSLTGSTPIIDVTREEPVTYGGRVPAGAIVVPGTRLRSLPASDYPVGCALIIGYRSSDSDWKLSAMEETHELGVSR